MAASDTISYTIAVEAAAEIVEQKLEILLSHPVHLGCLSMETQAKAAKEKLAVINEFFSTQDRLPKSTEWSGRLLRAMYNAEEFIDKFHLREARRRHKAVHMATRPLAALVPKYMLCRDLSNLVKAMKELCQDQYLTGNEPACSSSHASAPWGGKKLARLTSFWDRQVSMNFVCLEAKKEEIMKRIKEEATLLEVRGISILGEQGSGKTFLARWVYREAMSLGFDLRAWVRVSASTDKQEFLFKILKQVDKLAWDLMDFNEIKKMLRQKLAKTKRFLIVLDDVHLSDQQLLQELLMIIPYPGQGHIITTTQDDTIARIMNPAEPKPIELENLCSEESQKMLAAKLHRAPHVSNLKLEEKEILNLFPALPLCISLLGGLLSNAGEHKRTALVNDDSKMALSDLLQLSYHRLPVHLKPCFIYMVLFPITSPIPTRRLVRLWLAEGLLDSHCCDGERKRTPEDVGETFILELVERNVIDVVSWRADGSPKACQMLTSLYDMIRQTAMSTGFLHTHTGSKSRDKNNRNPPSQQQQQGPAPPRERAKVRWLAEHTNIVTDGRSDSFLDLNLGHVRSFLSFCPRRGMLTKDISTFLRKMTSKTDYSLLRVLDLEGVYKPSLQGVLYKLVLLRYLGLRSTVLDSIPSEVTDLHYLETLDIKHTNITSLPNSLWKARKLRHLHLNWFYIDLKKILKACSNNVMALTQLQTLSGLVIGEVTENLMTDHMDSLTTLKLFLQHSDTDTSGTAGKTVADWISFRLTNLQSLTFGVIQEAKPGKEDKLAKKVMPGEEAEPTEKDKPAKEVKPAALQVGLLPELSLAEQHHNLFKLYLLGQLNKPIWTRLLPGSLRVLTLSGSKMDIDMMPELGGLLRNLRTFGLLANSFLGTSLSFFRDGFPSLIILKIWKLPQLDKVFIDQGAMPHLKVLEFRHLNKLGSVEGINHCKELKNIRVISNSDSPDFVEQLKDQKERTFKLYFAKDTKRPGSIDGDDSHDDGEAAASLEYKLL